MFFRHQLRTDVVARFGFGCAISYVLKFMAVLKVTQLGGERGWMHKRSLLFAKRQRKWL
jgi:hypothetical protein